MYLLKLRTIYRGKSLNYGPYDSVYFSRRELLASRCDVTLVELAPVGDIILLYTLHKGCSCVYSRRTRGCVVCAIRGNRMRGGGVPARVVSIIRVQVSSPCSSLRVVFSSAGVWDTTLISETQHEIGHSQN